MFKNSEKYLLLCIIAIGFCMNVSLYYTNLDQSRNSDSLLYKKYELENKFKELEKKVKQIGEKVSNNITQIIKNEENLNIENNDEKLKELSLILKDKLQQLGRLSCEIAKDSTSVNGGWCAKISGVGGGEHKTDEKLVLFLSKFLKGKRVGSFGDGPGMYKQKLLKLNEVASYDAFDGAPFTEDTTEGRCQFLDLSVPIYHLEDKYDWIISTEVAEHIPKKFEKFYLDNLTRYAKEGIIMSWAKLGQGGHSHVNNQDLSYVKAQMEARGFRLDQDASDDIKKHSTLWWLKDNLNVYYRNQ